MLTAAAALGGALLAAAPAHADTYQVGPGRGYPTLAAVAGQLRPGDVVELEGDAEYPGDVVLRAPGTAASPITIRGTRVHGRRPVLRGGRSTLEVGADHYVIEGIELTGGAARCFYHHADDVTLRDAVVHDCPRHGILGADEDSGSLLLEHVEVYAAGSGDTFHPIYIATDERAHPGSVFRMRHCYVHDGAGGNNVKSRAERNEIHYNWIEGAKWHELELIGPVDRASGVKREDSEVIGNVIRKSGPGYAIRLGGDGSGESNGRYRFVNDTIVIGPDTTAAFRLFNGLESLEVFNTAIWREGGGPAVVMLEQEVRWARGGRRMAGSNNWVPARSPGVPSSWQGTIFGDDPGFSGERDYRPRKGSPLVDAGTSVFAGVADCAFPSPLVEPAGCPPQRRSEAPGTALVRRAVGQSDIGAFELDGDLPPVPPEEARPGVPASSGSPGATVGAATGKVAATGGCGCRSGVASRGPEGSLLLAFGAVLAGRRTRGSRRRRERR